MRYSTELQRWAQAEMRYSTEPKSQIMRSALLDDDENDHAVEEHRYNHEHHDGGGGSHEGEALLNPSGTAASPDYSTYISALANLSIQYNLSVIGIALVYMKDAFPHDISTKSALNSFVFLGAVFGQATMGYLGDLIGRPKGKLLPSFMPSLPLPSFSLTRLFFRSYDLHE